MSFNPPAHCGQLLVTRRLCASASVSLPAYMGEASTQCVIDGSGVVREEHYFHEACYY